MEEIKNNNTSNNNTEEKKITLDDVLKGYRDDNAEKVIKRNEARDKYARIVNGAKAIGSIIGGIVSARLLSRVTGKFLRISFRIVMIIAAFRMVF